MAKREIIAFPSEINDFAVAALHTIEKPERLAWLIDNALSTSFWLSSIPITDTRGKLSSEHPFFNFKPENEDLEFWLVSDAGRLFNSKPKADYLLVAKGDNAKIKLEMWLKPLNLVASISLFYILQEIQISKLIWLTWLETYTTENNILGKDSSLLFTDEQN